MGSLDRDKHVHITFRDILVDYSNFRKAYYYHDMSLGYRPARVEKRAIANVGKSGTFDQLA